MCLALANNPARTPSSWLASKMKPSALWRPLACRTGASTPPAREAAAVDLAIGLQAAFGLEDIKSVEKKKGKRAKKKLAAAPRSPHPLQMQDDFGNKLPVMAVHDNTSPLKPLEREAVQHVEDYYEKNAHQGQQYYEGYYDEAGAWVEGGWYDPGEYDYQDQGYDYDEGGYHNDQVEGGWAGDPGQVHTYDEKDPGR